MKINTDFPGANIDVLEVGENIIKIRPQLRDTTIDWFYWAFCVEGAQGETWTFDFLDKNCLGYFGPAVSKDFNEWQWAGPEVLDGYNRFTYNFASEDECVYFAHSMLYQPDRFSRFTKESNIPVRSLVMSEKGHSVDIAELGEGDSYVILTSRHHSCESTGTYVMEGMLKEFSKELMKGFCVATVPFIDIDGVLNGDQGKNRFPYDHNRDYLESPIYNSTAALIEYAKNKNIKYLLDLHAPWHFGGRNDTCFIAYSKDEMRDKYHKFSEILQKITESDINSLQYDKANNIDINVDWNTDDLATCSNYFAYRPTAELSFTFETMYFGVLENQVSQQKLVRLGENLAKALKVYNEAFALK
jgi:hypothetical protein